MPESRSEHHQSIARDELYFCAAINNSEGTSPPADVPIGRARFTKGWRKTLQLPLCAASRTKNPAQIEIWISPVDALATAWSTDDLLTPEEISNFSRIRVADARNSARAGRMLLRTALSEAVSGEIAPRQWRFLALPGCKPTVTADMPIFHFSVTHTERLAAVAISPTLQVGIDAETIEQTLDARVMSEFSSAREQKTLRDLRPAESSREFIRLWTLKEAYVKMTGRAAETDLSSLDLSVHRWHYGHDTRAKSYAHFETLFFANGHGLTHLALAIGLPKLDAGEVHLQVVSLENSAHGSWQIPCIS